MKKILVIMLFIFTLCLDAFSQEVYETLELGDKAPSFVLVDTGGNYIFANKLYGKKLLLLDFYATWCDNCNKELPHIEKLYSEFSKKGFQVLVLATDEDGKNTVVPYFKQHFTPLTVLIDKYQKAVEAFKVNALPTLFLVDLEGIIIYKAVGYQEENIDELREILLEYLGE